MQPKTDLSRDDDQVRKLYVAITKKEAYVSQSFQHRSHSLTYFLKSISLLSATSVLSQQPNVMTYNTTASLDKLTSTDFMHFGKYHVRFVFFPGPEVIQINWL